MQDRNVERPAYDPPAIEDLGTLEELTGSGANLSLGEAPAKS